MCVHVEEDGGQHLVGGEEVVDVADRVVGARVALAPKRDGPRVQLVGPLPHVHL